MKKRKTRLLPLLLDKQEVILLLCAGKTTVENWMKDGKLHHFYVGSSLRFYFSDVMAFAKYHRNKDLDNELEV